MERATWQFYRWTHDAWEGILEALESARHTIDFEQYYFVDLSKGLIGRRFVEVFKLKARAGVKVRLLLDATGSWEFYRSNVATELASAGVEVQFHKTIPRRHAGHFFQSFLRDHRRLIVVDGRVAFIGGIAIKEAARQWRDTHVRFEGAVVRSLQEEFHAVWSNVVHRSRFRVTSPQSTVDKFTVIPNGPLPKQRYISHIFEDGIRQAKKSIYITSPYFAPDHSFFRALRLASKRGVDVRILVPAASDNPLAQLVGESFYEGALRSGIRIYLYTPNFLHAKTIVIDNDWASVGSCNLDRLSLNYNYELNIVSYDPKFVFELKNHFFDDLQSSYEVDKDEWSLRSFVRKLIEKLSFILRPFV